MSWRMLGQYNAREHWTIYLLATVANLFLSIPLYIAARAGILAQVPAVGFTGQFISSYGVSWGIIVDYLWTLFMFQALLAVLILAMVATTLAQKGWRLLYVFSALVVAGFVGYWLGVRFLETLGWVSLLQNSGINSSGVYSDLFWYGLGATIFYTAMILFLRRSYDRLRERKAGVRSIPTLVSETLP